MTWDPPNMSRAICSTWLLLTFTDIHLPKKVSYWEQLQSSCRFHRLSLSCGTEQQTSNSCYCTTSSRQIMPITRSTYCMTLKNLETEIADLKPFGISYIHQHLYAFLCIITRVAGVTSTRLIKNSNSNSQSLLLECMEKNCCLLLW